MINPIAMWKVMAYVAAVSLLFVVLHYLNLHEIRW